MNKKPSNPKDVIGSTKIDLGLVPDTLVVCAATAFFEGASKYGRYNWRIAGVRASIYHGMVRRHIAAWWNGEDRGALTHVHHLDNAIACLAILRDAELYGMLADDRPPAPDRAAMSKLIDTQAGLVATLRETFKRESPKQYTLEDTPG